MEKQGQRGAITQGTSPWFSHCLRLFLYSIKGKGTLCLKGSNLRDKRMGKKIKIRKCRSCKTEYVTPTNWAGCCSEACLVKRLDYLETTRPQRDKKKIGRPNAFDPQSQRWLKLRWEVLIKYGRTCMCCGARPPKAIMQVDHIKPRSRYPELTWEIDNLQVLCRECNQGKRDHSEEDLRAD